MSTLKKFLMYGSWVLLFFIFSQIMIYIAINTTYKYKKVEMYTSAITEAEVQATSINGFAKCKVVNNTQSNIENKYIKVDCYSKKDTLMGTKYIKIDEIHPNEEKEFEVRFKFNKVDKVKLNIIDEIDSDVSEEQLVSDPEMTLAMIISALILLINFG